MAARRCEHERKRTRHRNRSPRNDGCHCVVTGGGGFIGTWVLRALLARGVTAVAFDAHENPTRWQRLLGERAADVPFVRGSLLDRELLARVIAEQYWLHAELPSVGIRPHVVYGPERDQGMTAGPSLAARAAARGEAFHINYTGLAGYDYVEDVAEAFVRTALETPAGANVVNLPSEAATVEQLVAAIDAAVPGAAATISIGGPVLPFNESRREHVITQFISDWRTTSVAEGMREWFSSI